jgi:hypothetical protein
MMMIATAVLIPIFFFFLLVLRGAGLSTRVVTVVRVLRDFSAIVIPSPADASRAQLRLTVVRETFQTDTAVA